MRHAIRFAFLLATAAAACTGGSGGAGPSPSDGGAPIANVSEDVAAYFRAACEAEVRCGREDAPFFSGYTPTFEECLNASFLFCSPSWANLTLPGLASCLSAWQDADCARLEELGRPPACEAVVSSLNGRRSSKGDGARCGNGVFCDAGFFCDQTHATSCGACRPQKQPGQGCIGALAECVDNGICQQEDGTLRCVALPKLGQSCVDSGSCAEGACQAGVCAELEDLRGTACRDEFDCGFTWKCLDGTCQDGRAPGEACSESRECRGLAACREGRCTLPSLCGAGEEGAVCGTNASCAAGLACDQIEDRCLPVGRLGDACSGADTCEDGLVCSLQDGSLDAVCVKRPVVTDCDCLQGLFCTEPECAALANCE